MDAGYQIDKVQHGEQPDDFKPMSSIGNGVEEIRVRDDTGVYRIIYTARLRVKVVVLHVFAKKSKPHLTKTLALPRDGSMS